LLKGQIEPEIRRTNEKFQTDWYFTLYHWLNKTPEKPLAAGELMVRVRFYTTFLKFS